MAGVGHVKVHREIIDSEIWKDAEALKLFLYCIIKANWKETEYRGILIPRGSFGTTEERLCDAMDWSSRNTLTEKLKKLHGAIEKHSQPGNRFSILTVINYGTYQKSFSENQQPTEQPTDGPTDVPTERPTDQQKKNSIKKGKEDQEQIPSAFDRFWDAFPKARRTKRKKALAAFTKAVKAGADPEAIVAAAVEYAASPVGQGRFVQGPEPWLNGGCWDDDRSAWQRGDDLPFGGTKTNPLELTARVWP